VKLGIRKSFQILAPGNSLRRRTAYRLALVRLILVPVIVLAVYYLVRMGWIVDRIVNVDAPAAGLAQQVSIEMLEARRAERNYLLFQATTYLATNRAALLKTQQALQAIQNLEPNDQGVVQEASEAPTLYQPRFSGAASALGKPGQEPTDRIRAVVKAYEQDPENLLKRAKRSKRPQLVEDLRRQVSSFDSQITQTAQQGNRTLQQVTADLQDSSQKILSIAADVESRNWSRVQLGHADARHLIERAEWALSVVSAVTLLMSIWVSYTLPRAVVKPLLNLKGAVDHAAEENFEIDFDVQGKGEIVDLTESLRGLLAAVRQKSQPA
jgi:methyl-accepting chemotaxis protein